MISLLNTKPETVSVNKTMSVEPSGQEDSYEIYLDVCQDPCTPITASVSVVNGAGLGDAGFGTFFFPDGLINLFLHSNMFTVMANLQIEN